ncbi:MAG: flavodoxin domain-containing protein [Eubacteriales bacterium]|nr:flavodoxin domain-containing protein [Eubacteriales bacterium]
MKVAVFYFTTSGNTEAMAEALAEGFKDAGAEVNLKAFDEVSDADLEGVELFCLGSPAQGSEEVDDSEFRPFYDQHKSELQAAKNFFFGSFGWGGGQYMEDFVEEAKGDGLEVVDFLTHLEEPDEDCLDSLKAKAKELSA